MPERQSGIYIQQQYCHLLPEPFFKTKRKRAVHRIEVRHLQSDHHLQQSAQAALAYVYSPAPSPTILEAPCPTFLKFQDR